MCGAPGGIRTPNLLIRSQMLYPLSYGRISFVLSRDNEKEHYTQVNFRPKQQARRVN